MSGCENILLGDLNFHLDQQDTWTLKFYDFLEQFSFTQLVNTPTHIQGHILDALCVRDSFSWAIRPKVNIQPTINDSQFLEVLLLKLRGETIKYASGLKKRQNNDEIKFISEIQTLERNPSPEILESLEEKKRLLQEIRDKRLKGNYIRSRAEWIKEGEKPSKYFCSLEKAGYLEKTVKRLINSNGETITDQKLILNTIKEFYQDLFQSKDYNLIESNLN